MPVLACTRLNRKQRDSCTGEFGSYTLSSVVADALSSALKQFVDRTAKVYLD